MTLQTLASAADLDDLAAGDTPYLLYFTATWCGPCQQFSPVVAEVADELDDRFRFVKVDIDDHPDVADRFEIRGVPVVKVLSGDQIVMSSVGGMSRSRLRRTLGTVTDTLADPPGPLAQAPR